MDSTTRTDVTRSSSQTASDPFDFQTIVDTYTVSGGGLSQTSTSTFDKAARTVTDRSPMGRQVTTTFDTHDRPVLDVAAGRQDVSTAYDARGRVTAVAQGDRQTTVTYGSDGRVASTIDPDGGVTSITRDSLGRPTQVTAPDSSTTGYQWDAASQLTRLTAPDGRLFDFTYDDDGNLTTTSEGATPASGGAARITDTAYDNAGRLTSLERPSGKTVTFGYDAAGRSTGATASDGTATSPSYEAVTDGKGGRLASLSTDQGASTSMVYDGALLSGIDQAGDTATGDATGAAPRVSFSYDGLLRPASQSIDGDAVSATYNLDGQATQVGPVSFAYDQATGDPTGMSAGVLSTSISTSGFGELSGQSAAVDSGGGGSVGVFSESLTRDQLGRITARTATDDTGTHTDGYAYDDAGRLVQVTRDGAVTQTFAYDATGAMISRGTGGLITGQFTLDSHGLPTATPDGTTLAWSTDGELLSQTTSSGAQTQFGYDGFGRLSQVTLPDGRTGSYRYDAVGRRTAVRLDGQLVRRYVYGASLWPQARIDAAGDVIERYVYASQSHVPDVIVRRDGQRIGLITDALGSVRAAVDIDTGTTLQRLDYDAYGRTTRNTNPGLQPFGFKGALTDPLAEGAGLIWMGVRAYQPSLARFTTPDPAGLTAVWNDPDALAGDPINLIDTDGAMSQTIDRKGNIKGPFEQTAESTGSGIFSGIASFANGAWCVFSPNCSREQGQADGANAGADFYDSLFNTCAARNNGWFNFGVDLGFAFPGKGGKGGKGGSGREGGRGPRGSDRGGTVAPAESPVWQGLDRVKGSNQRRDKYGNIYEYDRAHGEIEVYNKDRVHQGALDPISGDLIKDPVKGRKPRR